MHWRKKKTGPYLMIMLIFSFGSHAGCRHSNVHASHAIPYSIWRPAEKRFLTMSVIICAKVLKSMICKSPSRFCRIGPDYLS